MRSRPEDVSTAGADPPMTTITRVENPTDSYNFNSAVWNDVCENFSTKRLTVPSDMPIVLSGLAKDFAQRLPSDEYVAGLWRSTMPRSLLWRTSHPTGDRQDYFAPSWSWLSVCSPVKLAIRAKFRKQHPLVVVGSTSMAYAYDAPFGPLTSGTLEIGGVLRRVHLSLGEILRDFTLSVMDDGNDGEDVRRVIGPSYDEHEGQLCCLELDHRAPPQEVEYFCLFVTIEQWSNRRSSRDINCLLLEPTEGADTFRRVGRLELGDLYALKMRYRLDLTVENDEGGPMLPDEDEASFWKGNSIMVGDMQDEILREARKKQESTEQGSTEQESQANEEVAGSLDDTGGDTKESCFNALYQFDAVIHERGVESGLIQSLTWQQWRVLTIC